MVELILKSHVIYPVIAQPLTYFRKYDDLVSNSNLCHVIVYVSILGSRNSVLGDDVKCGQLVNLPVIW